MQLLSVQGVALISVELVEVIGDGLAEGFLVLLLGLKLGVDALELSEAVSVDVHHLFRVFQERVVEQVKQDLQEAVHVVAKLVHVHESISVRVDVSKCCVDELFSQRDPDLVLTEERNEEVFELVAVEVATLISVELNEVGLDLGLEHLRVVAVT